MPEIETRESCDEERWMEGRISIWDTGFSWASGANVDLVASGGDLSGIEASNWVMVVGVTASTSSSTIGVTGSGGRG